MLRFLWQRWGTQWREPGLVSSKFVFTDSDDSWAAQNTSDAEDCSPHLAAADAGTGLVTLTFPPCRHAVILSAHIDGLDPDDPTDMRSVHIPHITPTQARLGTCTLSIVNVETDPLVMADPVDGAVLTVVMVCNK